MANYDKRISDLINDIKADKSIHTKWRNKAIARIDEAQAFIATGQRVTNMKPPAGMYADGQPMNMEPQSVQVPADLMNPMQHIDCTCLPGTIDTACPVHSN